MRWRTYWPSLATSLVVAIALLVVLTTPYLAAKPPRPDLPDPSRSYPSEYSSAGSDAGHDLLYHDLFGAGGALRQANLFLIGSSHYEFGFSAAALSRSLSKDGQPIRAYNMGLGCGESASFGLEILARNHVTGGSAVIEPGTLASLGGWVCGKTAERHDLVEAYTTVLKIWSKYLYDWTLDPVLPRLFVSPEGVDVRRFLFGMVIERDWAQGDVVRVWHPVEGEFYPGPPLRLAEVGTSAQALGVTWRLPPGAFDLGPRLRQQAAEIGVDLTVASLPWAMPILDYDQRYQAQLARIKPVATAETRCFVGIPVEGLKSWDRGNHLSGESRMAATERLAAGLETQHCAGVAPVQETLIQ